MPLVYACIRPPGSQKASPVIASALDALNQERALHLPTTLLLIAPPGVTHRESMGLVTSIDGAEADRELAERIGHEAQLIDLPVAVGTRWHPNAGLESIVDAAKEARVLGVVCSWLDVRYHFEFGRAVSRALSIYEGSVGIVCIAELARRQGAAGQPHPAGKVFDRQYSRAIERWDVKWLLHLDADFRRHANEAAVPQTAVLMGALSASRIQTRVLAQEAGVIVASIDVQGPRRKRSEEANG